MTCFVASVVCYQKLYVVKDYKLGKLPTQAHMALNLPICFPQKICL